MLLQAIEADGLSGCQDMRFIKGIFERGAPVSRCSEGYPLFGHRRVWATGVIGRDQPGNVGKHGRVGWLSCEWADILHDISTFRNRDKTTTPYFAKVGDTLPIFPEVFKGLDYFSV